MIKTLDQKLVKFSKIRIICSGDIYEVYNYQYAYSYNFGDLRKFNDEINSEVDTRRLDNISRAQVAIRRIINANAFRNGYVPLFITYTYSENMQSMQKARSDFKAHIRKMNFYFSTEKIQYVVVPELQARGAIHFHAVFFNLPYDLVALERQNRTIAKLWAHGFVDVVATHHVRNLGAYVAKYFGKQWVEFLKKGDKKFWRSRGLVPSLIFRTLDSFPDLSTLDLEFENNFDSGILGDTNYKQYRVKPFVAN